MRIAFAGLIGLGGLAILLSLGVWQIQRLAWKEALLDDIATRISAAPVALPSALDPETHRYVPVQVAGTFRNDTSARMLASRRRVGAVYRHILPFKTQSGEAILVDIGWTLADRALPTVPQMPVTLTGNLDWPRERDGFTPEPDLNAGLWYARDVPALAEALGTAPVLLVLREQPSPKLPATPWPVDTSNVPNDHLQYAITWFSLAAIWLAMTVFFLLRRGAPSES